MRLIRVLTLPALVAAVVLSGRQAGRPTATVVTTANYVYTDSLVEEDAQVWARWLSDEVARQTAQEAQEAAEAAQAEYEAQVAAQEAQRATQRASAPTTVTGSGACGVPGTTLATNPTVGPNINGESGGTLNAYNCYSTASGKYQFLDSTWQSACRALGLSCPARAMDASEALQDAVAAGLWDGGKGCSHWSQC